MHITEGFLPISHCIAWGAASLAPTIVGVRAISKNLEQKKDNRVLLAASAAFLFTLSSLRMPSITGSSSHPVGTSVGTYLFGPGAMPALALITLVFQALLLAHGGLTTLGANLFSLGIAGPWAMWFVLHLMSKAGKRTANALCALPGRSRDRAIFFSTVVGDLATYATTAVQLALAYPSPQGGYLASFLKFSGVFFITQIPIAIAEGMLTVALLRALPEGEMRGFRKAASDSKEIGWLPRALAVLGVLTVLVGGMFLLNRGGGRRGTPILGTDDKAESAILALRPGYHRIATPVWTPGDTAEGWLFASQGAAGIGILGWVVYRLRGRREEKPAGGPKVRRHIHLHPHLSDVAFTNRWRHRNPWEKVLFGAGFLVVAMLVPPSWCLLIALIVSVAAIAGARIPPRSWVAVLSIPVSFAVLTAMGILIQFNASGSHFAVSIAWSGLPTAMGLLVRSFAAICCLAFIGWTTPLMELIPIGARAGVPTVLVDLALMIYRFLFIMTTTLTEMRRAQSWRLGRADYKSRMRAVSMLAGSLFIRCIHRVRRLEDGMEARGYDGHLWVLAPEHPASPLVVSGTLALEFAVLFGGLWIAKGRI